jgi:NAD-dependent dihydropyrimidine dehydrogenase PreA subunit
MTSAEKIQETISRYDSLIDQGYGCGEAALRSLGDVFNFELGGETLRIGMVHTKGSHVGNRCAIIQSALTLCSLRYGRLRENGNRAPAKALALKLQRDFAALLGACHCRELFEAWEGDAFCGKAVSDAGLAAAAELLDGAPELIKNLMDGLKKKFQVHEKLWDLTEYFMSGTDWGFVAAAGEEGALDPSVFKTHEIETAYRRGVLDKTAADTGEIQYKLGSFHRRIDCFMRGERAKWYALPEEVKKTVVEYEQDIKFWVIPRRKPGVNRGVVRPLPIEQALEIVEKTSGRFFLQECDCRIYRDDGDHLVNTCLHFPDSLLNTSADRGYGRIITREEAKDVLLRADENGLVHNFEGDAFCNCCGCCCWALRGIGVYEKEGYDLFSEYIDAPYAAGIDGEKCTGCGRCVRRCPAGAISRQGKRAAVDPGRCLGCGVCRRACNKNAITLAARLKPARAV